MKPLPFLLLLLLAAPVSAASPAKASLLCEVAALTPGKPVTLGLHFKVEKGWHLYWRNPGDSGQAPQVQWTLPKGFKAGEILWPVPKRLTASGLVDYGYEGDLLLMVPLQVPPGLKTGQEVSLSAKLKWLVCREVCLPGEAKLDLPLSVKDRRMGPAMKTRSLFQRARDSLPLPLPEELRATAILDSKSLKLSLEGPGKFQGASFLPAQPGLVENAAAQDFHLLENGFQLTLQRSPEGNQSAKDLTGVLLAGDPKAPKAYWVSTRLYRLK